MWEGGAGGDQGAGGVLSFLAQWLEAEAARAGGFEGQDTMSYIHCKTHIQQTKHLSASTASSSLEPKQRL